MKKYYRIEIQNGGAEVQFGVITDKDDIRLMLSAIKNEEDVSWIEKDNGETLECFNQDMLYSTYGPNYEYSKVTIRKNDKAYTDYRNSDDGEEILDCKIEETKICTFSQSNPYLSPKDKEKYSEDCLIWGNQKVEKRVRFPILLELEEELDVSNLFIGIINTDETIGADEIIQDAFYISKENQIKILKVYLKDNYDNETELLEYISEIFDENKEELLEPFKCEIDDIEGKGEWENDYNLVMTMQEEVLYDKGEY